MENQTSIKIGILDIHNGYEENTWFVDTFTYGNIHENISENYKEVKIRNFDDLMLNINIYLKPNETSVLNITELYYDDSVVIQCIYNICEDVNNPTLNKLASQLTKNINVKGNMIFIKRDIKDNKFKYIDFTISDLINLVKDTFIHNSLILKPSLNFDNDKIIDFPYINDVLESKIEEYTYKNIRYYEHKFIDYTFTFYCDISATREETNLNIVASTIYGKKIYGEVTIILTTTREDFNQNLNLTKDLLEKIYYIYATKNEEINFQKYAIKPSQTSDDLNNNCFPAVTYCPNIFYVISREYNNIKNQKILVNPNNFKEILNDMI